MDKSSRDKKIQKAKPDIFTETPFTIFDVSNIKYESAITSLLEDDPTANQAEFCVHIRS